MCGRIAMTHAALERLEEEFGGRWRWLPPPASYNLGPGDPAPVVLRDESGPVLDGYRWGLIPFWAKDPEFGRKAFNARGETVHEKPAFRHALRRQRCLVPVPGFYEWQAVPGQRQKQPWWIYPADRPILTFAGIWDRWSPEADTEPVYSFAIVTTDPNRWMRDLHHRMPVILEGEEREAWLDPSTGLDELRSLLKPAREDCLARYRIGTRINNPRYDAPDLLDPLDEP